MADFERPREPAQDGETKKYNLADEFEASQRPGHDWQRDAGIYPAELADRARAAGLRQAARQDVERLARPARQDRPASPQQPGRYSAAEDPAWEVEGEAHSRRTAERTQRYLDSGPAILRPLRRLRLWTKNGIPPEK